ncbi:TRAP-type C4-dicarboxylate transport system permease small subunit [Litoreibacter meonggei]|uniref:TRAP transporter small permease protein n=1 Tax=Litoreibacter meonggei TaxID=1049199 RepID=A0A497WFU6_9RHOB|nr:TRAP transporter small permease [Litoreibacter meonggei]RLJ51978.1 TRAP-type C4-dicarboxylate transport system permease small subunit [Litoreibacter meonggei]
MAQPDPQKTDDVLGQNSLDIGLIMQNSLGVAAGLLLFCLILVTCVDVVGRYFFSAPLSGAFEVTEIMLAALVFTALPLTTERREHIEVDLLNVGLSDKFQKLLSAFAGLFSAALLATLAWRLASHAASSFEDGAVTNALSIPLAPFGFLAAFSCMVSACIAFLRGIHPPRNR